MDIYYFGPEGTFTHQAAMEFSKGYHVPNAALTAVPSISEALESVQREMAQEKSSFACIPLENSIQGSVTAAWDGLGHKAPLGLPSLQIVSALRLSIHQNLMVKDASVPLAELRTVYSHPQALAQCRYWLSKHLPKAVAVNAESTAAAARRVAEHNDNTAAAIGAKAAAVLYKLHVAEESIEDIGNNTTRFGLVGDPKSLASLTAAGFGNGDSSRQTLSLLLSRVENSPGGLLKVLEPFSKSGFNLTRIESRPVGTHLGTYVFYVDVEWDTATSHEHWSRVKKVLLDLGVEVKVLGHFSEF